MLSQSSASVPIAASPADAALRSSIVPASASRLRFTNSTGSTCSSVK
jgi:hypothetical protein